MPTVSEFLYTRTPLFLLWEPGEALLQRARPRLAGGGIPFLLFPGQRTCGCSRSWAVTWPAARWWWWPSPGGGSCARSASRPPAGARWPQTWSGSSGPEGAASRWWMCCGDRRCFRGRTLAPPSTWGGCLAPDWAGEGRAWGTVHPPWGPLWVGGAGGKGGSERISATKTNCRRQKSM